MSTWKSRVNTLHQKHDLRPPTYRTFRTGGSDHRPSYRSNINSPLGNNFGKGGSKNDAEHMAARNLMSMLIEQGFIDVTQSNEVIPQSYYKDESIGKTKLTNRTKLSERSLTNDESIKSQENLYGQYQPPLNDQQKSNEVSSSSNGSLSSNNNYLPNQTPRIHNYSSQPIIYPSSSCQTSTSDTLTRDNESSRHTKTIENLDTMVRGQKESSINCTPSLLLYGESYNSNMMSNNSFNRNNMSSYGPYQAERMRMRTYRREVPSSCRSIREEEDRPQFLLIDSRLYEDGIKNNDLANYFYIYHGIHIFATSNHAVMNSRSSNKNRIHVIPNEKYIDQAISLQIGLIAGQFNKRVIKNKRSPIFTVLSNSDLQSITVIFHRLLSKKSCDLNVYKNCSSLIQDLIQLTSN